MITKYFILLYENTKMSLGFSSTHIEYLWIKITSKLFYMTIKIIFENEYECGHVKKAH